MSKKSRTAPAGAKRRNPAAQREAGDPKNTELERTLRLQSKVVEGRGNSLLSKANDVRASNAILRDAISKLRLERSLHLHHKEGMEARLAELNKLVPALVDTCNVLLFEGEKVQTKVPQAHQDAMSVRAQQEDQLAASREQVAAKAKGEVAPVQIVDAVAAAVEAAKLKVAEQIERSWWHPRDLSKQGMRLNVLDPDAPIEEVHNTAQLSLIHI